MQAFSLSVFSRSWMNEVITLLLNILCILHTDSNKNKDFLLPIIFKIDCRTEMSICYDWGEGSGLLLYEKPCDKDKEGKTLKD